MPGRFDAFCDYALVRQRGRERPPKRDPDPDYCNPLMSRGGNSFFSHECERAFRELNRVRRRAGMS